MYSVGYRKCLENMNDFYSYDFVLLFGCDCFVLFDGGLINIVEWMKINEWMGE